MQAIFDYIRSELQEVYSPEEIRSLSFLLLETLTGKNRAQLLSNKNIELSDTKQHEFETILSRLKKSEPIQYILGSTEFYNCTFAVDKNVLIPRPETAELVDWIVKKETQCKSLLDIGTGSGCIAVACAKQLPSCSVCALDVSETALKVAAENAKRNNVEVEYFNADILQQPVYKRKWDVIVSNPPYVCHSEKSGMEQNVLAYEPHLALFVPDENPLLFYRAIAHFAKQHLSSGGRLYFEINRAYGSAVREMLETLEFTEVTVRQDIFGNDRMIKARL
jgi:release factor glutamine methyltransferase